MRHTIRPAFDVVVAGGGPVGLLLACELRLGGASVLLLEKASDPASPFKQAPFGMRGLSAPTIEAFDRRGLLAAVTPPAASPPRRHAGHFAGIALDDGKVDAGRWPFRLPGPAEAGMAADMAGIEAALTSCAGVLGVEIRRGVAVEGFDQSSDAVRVRAGGEMIAAGWLVGCDGGRSAVRKAGRFGFAGTEPEFTGYSVEVELADAQAHASRGLRPGRNPTPGGFYMQMRPGTLAMVEFDGGACHRTVPLTRDHVEAVLRRVSGADVTVTALHVAATWTDRAFQAVTYRDGRALLAGDAAHVHSPLGGQGLNLGLGDAMNLGWKLAATVRGDAPEGLLDSYERERYPVGARVLDWSRAQVALMRPSRSSRALAAIVGDLLATRDGATYVAERIRAVTQAYDLGGGHPLVGRSAPDFALADGTRLGERLRAGRGLLLDFDCRAPLRPLAGLWGDRVAYVASAATKNLGLGAVLVRPDGIVAWAAEADVDPNVEDAARCASRWFGRPV